MTQVKKYREENRGLTKQQAREEVAWQQMIKRLRDRNGLNNNSLTNGTYGAGYLFTKRRK